MNKNFKDEKKNKSLAGWNNVLTTILSLKNPKHQNEKLRLKNQKSKIYLYQCDTSMGGKWAITYSKPTNLTLFNGSGLGSRLAIE